MSSSKKRGYMARLKEDPVIGPILDAVNKTLLTVIEILITKVFIISIEIVMRYYCSTSVYN
jgi:hypothetical protein